MKREIPGKGSFDVCVRPRGGEDSRGKTPKQRLPILSTATAAASPPPHTRNDPQVGREQNAAGHSGLLINRYSGVGRRSETVTPGGASGTVYRGSISGGLASVRQV